MQITSTGVSTTGSPRLLEAVDDEDGWQFTILGNNDKRHAVILLSDKDTEELAKLVLERLKAKRKK